MSLDREGFLSPQLMGFAARFRDENADAFGLVVRMSELGQKVLFHIKKLRPTSQNLLAGAFFIRGLQTVQGATLMAEKGMNLEARTLARSAFETLFYLGAAVKDENFSEDFMRDHIHRLDVLAKAHRDLAIAPEKDHAALAAAIDGARDIVGEGRSLTIRAAAIRADMDVSYQGFYRGLSNDSAHPTVTSLSSHFEKDEEGEPIGLLWGPEQKLPKDVLDTLYLIALVGILLIDTINSRIADKDVEAESHRLSRVYLSLRGHSPIAEVDPGSG